MVLVFRNDLNILYMIWKTIGRYVSRIKVQSGGYGNVLYINHPNGYTTVYAHLDRFPAAIAKFVKQYQYAKERFEVEIFPQQGQFTFQKGEQIGTMGTSGRSFGPHLHFEIRDSKTEEPINPLLFGILVADNQPPRMHQLKVYLLNHKLESLKSSTFDLQMRGNQYRVPGDTVSVSVDRVGVALKVYDHMDGVGNWNGIYSLEAFVDDSLIYHFEMERFSFSESRYINAHMDYAERVENKSYLNRCFLLPGNKLSVYNKIVDKGVIQVRPDKAKEVRLVAKDVVGNKKELRFWLKRKAQVNLPPGRRHNYVLIRDEVNLIDDGSIYLRFPKNSFYENVYLQYQADHEQSDNIYSSVYHIDQPTIPVHRYFSIGIRPIGLPEQLKDKAIIAYCNPDNTITSYGGKWENERLFTRSRTFGDYSIMLDQEAPSIEVVRFKKDMRQASKMSFRITDNYSTAGSAKGLQYRATVDGQWIMMEYDAKNDLLIHRFDERITKGEHFLRLEVIDDRKNKKVFESTFIR